jgi:hypothetical protein
MHDGDAGSNRTLPDDQLSSAGDKRRLTDLDAGDVGNSVERPGGSADRKLQVALTRLLREQGARKNDDGSGYHQ